VRRGTESEVEVVVEGRGVVLRAEREVTEEAVEWRCSCVRKIHAGHTTTSEAAEEAVEAEAEAAAAPGSQLFCPP
jgi:hypothetical protein